MCQIQVSKTLFDQERAEGFSQKLLDTVNAGSLSLMISIGHRTGLFDTMSNLPPSTSPEIADTAGLNERYVREWLGAMAISGVVEYDTSTRCYSLPAEHAAYLTRAAAENNMAVFTQYIAVMGQVEDDILECFRNGGGVPYSRFPRFHEVMAEDSGQSVLSSLFDHILPLIPRIQDRLESGIDVLDLGCGRGKALIAMAARFPQSRFVGYDLSEEAIAYADAQAQMRNLKNIRFEVRDLSDYSQTADIHSYDFVTTFDAVHDQAKPMELLKGIRRTLRPGGTYMMQDISSSSHIENNMNHPLGTLLYTISTMHCMTVSLAQGGEGLGTVWGRELAQTMLREAGFGQITIHQLDHDVQNEYYVMPV